jgi:hypothetical protein
MGALSAIGSTWLGVLPRVVPPQVEAQGTNVTSRPQTPTSEASTPAVPKGPPYAVQYTSNDLLQLHALSEQLHWQPWVPKEATQSVSYVESYAANNVLSIIIGPYLLEESNAPIAELEGPTSVTTTTLADGTSGTWWWVPGEGGSYYRLNVQMGSIYIRMAGSSSLSVMSQLADSLEPLMAVH